MKPLLMICIAALAATALVPADADARRGVRRPRVVIVAPRRFYYDTEPGAIYGFAPGNYIPGPNGMLYGPYPVRPPVVSYGPYGPDYYE
ncbi:MAG: hypothetical protein JO084_05700 [Bradyrhizobiaceae bacterium]|nr:hypothetical protein [Hyphomicrobiales bacterium]MBV9427194.1 hypothetical protein [Bradyrhizobiaceae bacterium]